MIALLGSGCGGPHSGPPGSTDESRDINANSVFGSVDVKQMGDLCAGRVQLAQGVASINDSCFSGETNVVLCTDASAVNPVQCSPMKGKLALTGTGSDLISYARIR